jgi:photosystem II stability/assembly factor-like uncharacterized protein
MSSVAKASRRSGTRTVGRARLKPHASRSGRWPLIAVAALLLGAGVVIMFMTRQAGGAATPWSRLGTEDVHSLAFVGEDPSRLLFGHHRGISSSSDGGRSWQTLGTRSDAMSLGAATDGSIVIAGHEVFAASRDGGRTWEDVAADLPSLDIHGFARDPGDPARMWAYLATGGLWESGDGGGSWERVQEENVLFPVAAKTAAGTRLFGVTANGLAASDDGGRTWRAMTTPEIYPIASLAATADGTVLVAAGADGLARSADGGATWSKMPFEGQPAAIAVTAGGQTIALVTRSTEFFRSDDGGKTWPGP